MGMCHNVQLRSLFDYGDETVRDRFGGGTDEHGRLRVKCRIGPSACYPDTPDFRAGQEDHLFVRVRRQPLNQNASEERLDDKGWAPDAGRVLRTFLSAFEFRAR